MTKTPHSIWELIRHYRFNSVFFSYLKYMLLLLAVPFLTVTVLLTYYNASSVNTEAKKKNEQIMSKKLQRKMSKRKTVRNK